MKIEESFGGSGNIDILFALLCYSCYAMLVLGIYTFFMM